MFGGEPALLRLAAGGSDTLDFLAASGYLDLLAFYTILTYRYILAELFGYFLDFDVMNAPTGSGALPLQEYPRDIPPGWSPGDPSYSLKSYMDKLRIWYRIYTGDDESVGPMVAGRLYGQASRIAMSLRVPRPHGGYDTGDAALVRLAVDEVTDPLTGAVIQQHIPSGVQTLMNQLRATFGQQDQDLATQSLEKAFSLTRGKMSLPEYAAEFDNRMEEAADRAGLQVNDVGRFYLFFKNSGLPKIGTLTTSSSR